MFFGSKADKDRKEIIPYVEKIKAIYPTIEKLTNDELRARSAELSKSIADVIAEDEATIAKNKELLESHTTTLKEKERLSSEIEMLTKRIELSAIGIFCGNNEPDSRALSARVSLCCAYALDSGIVAGEEIVIFIVFHQSSAFP